MAKKVLKPGCVEAPVPAVLVSCADKEGNDNLLTIAWTGIACSEPPMVYISVRPERYSCHMISETGEFVINLTTKEMIRAVDGCGFRTGRLGNKWALCGLTKAPATVVKAPIVAESPVNIECRVKQVLHLGSHDMFLAEVVGVQADEECLDERGSFDPEKVRLAAYAGGAYFSLGEVIGRFGFSVRRKTPADRRKATGTASIPRTLKTED